MEVQIQIMGHQQQEPASGPRHLILGPIVPEGEIWTLKLLAAKNNMAPDQRPDRVTAELSVCVFLPSCLSSHGHQPPGTWVLLEGNVEVPQFKPVKWEGYLELPAGSQLGAWFRGADKEDVVELDAIFDVEGPADVPRTRKLDALQPDEHLKFNEEEAQQATTFAKQVWLDSQGRREATKATW